jgi:hypothetical protein
MTIAFSMMAVQRIEPHRKMLARFHPRTRRPSRNINRKKTYRTPSRTHESSFISSPALISPLKKWLLEAVQKVPDARQAKLVPAKAGIQSHNERTSCTLNDEACPRGSGGMKPNAADGTFSTASYPNISSLAALFMACCS